MKLRYKIFIISVVLLASGSLYAIADAKAISPLETLKEPIDQILVLLNDPSYQGQKGQALQRKKIWKIARPVFNLEEISRRAIGKSWERFSSDEKSQFTKIFTDFLGNTYIDKLQGEFHNIIIDFDKELVKGSKALVRTRLRRETVEIPIDYRMQQIDGVWKIYDILVENGVSIVKNYFVQFNSMLQKGSPADLIEQLEKKLAQQQKNSSKQP